MTLESRLTQEEEKVRPKNESSEMLRSVEDRLENHSDKVRVSEALKTMLSDAGARKEGLDRAYGEKWEKFFASGTSMEGIPEGKLDPAKAELNREIAGTSAEADGLWKKLAERMREVLRAAVAAGIILEGSGTEALAANDRIAVDPRIFENGSDQPSRHERMGQGFDIAVGRDVPGSPDEGAIIRRINLKKLQRVTPAMIEHSQQGHPKVGSPDPWSPPAWHQ